MERPKVGIALVEEVAGRKGPDRKGPDLSPIQNLWDVLEKRCGPTGGGLIHVFWLWAGSAGSRLA